MRRKVILQFLFIVVAVALMSAIANAQSTCDLAYWPGRTTASAYEQEACAKVANFYNEGNPSFTYTLSPDGGSIAAGTLTCSGNAVKKSDGTTSSFAFGGFGFTVGDCPEGPEDCVAARDVGERYPGALQAGYTNGCGDSAQGVNGTSCEVKPAGSGVCFTSGSCFGEYEFTGQACNGQPDVTDTGAQNGQCASSGGITVCYEKSKPGCGSVNGDDICFNGVPEGGCSYTGGGGMVCDQTATSPPAPTTPDGSQQATPDGSFGADTGDGTINNYNYYGSGSVASSGTGTSGNAPSGDSGGGVGDGTGEGGTGCPEGGCNGALPTLDPVDSIGDQTQAYYDQLAAVPIVSAIAGLGQSMPSGACPIETTAIDYLNTSITLDAHCDLWENIRGVIEAVMLACWVLVGARIILSS